MKKLTIRNMLKWQKTNFPKHKPMIESDVIRLYGKQEEKGQSAHKNYLSWKRVKNTPKTS